MLRKFLALLVCLAASPLAHADSYFVYVNEKTEVPQLVLSVSGTRLRIETSSIAYTVIDLPARTVTLVDVPSRSYTTTSIEQVQEIMQRISSVDPAQSSLLQLALENLSEAQRHEAEDLLRQAQADANYPFLKTGTRDREAGIGCDIYHQRSSTGDTRQLCAADFSALKLSRSDLQTLRGTLQLLRDTRGPWRPLTEVPGLPLRYAGSFGGQRYAGGGRLQRLSHHQLPAERFRAPSDYRIVSLLEMLSRISAF